ncbi:hypothetical protein LRS06_17120 [Hymenobacter sp. J193]|uniref:glycoside hydrolase family 113 n=1 Tax=Hymenobacter sp. J193 TaxID=2898429 RepID=UPI002151ED3F|nr:hypothetical protein [Hymenobacter sp. J193]MCR5889459.1 hypothetical protein [Hymenobacter sp. J193]
MSFTTSAIRRWLLVLLLLGAAFTAWQLTRPPRPAPARVAQPAIGPPPTDGRLRGVSWVAGDSASALDLEPLVRARVTWIAQTPFGWQAGAAVPEIRLQTGKGSRHYWGESDAGIIQTAERARQRGISTLLKPHLWLRGGSGSWPGDINMTSPADWQQWFASYSLFILHYARLAEEHQLEALCIGTELQHASVGHETEWRTLIRQIRGVYHGQLTYAANWSGEFEQVPFWDALDFIGIQAYFPLSKTERPEKAALLQAWQEPLRRIKAIQRRFKKPVVFTEIGYKTTPDAATEPWTWPDRRAVLTSADEATQAACYAAMFETFWPQKWFRGLFVWKLVPRPDA